MKMKPYFMLSFLLSFVLAATTLIAQTEEKTEENADTTAPVVTKKAEVKKKKTSTFTLGEIIVRDRAIANIEDATTTTEITAKDIEARSNKNLADALEMVPGLQIEQHRKGHIRFNMRGFSMDKIALLVDGIPVTDVYESNTDISSLGVQNASKIIVNRGVCSALYGTNGTVGSINIVSKRPEKLVAKLNTEYGYLKDYSFNLVHGMPFKLPIGTMYYWLSASTAYKGEYNVSSRLTKSERRKWYDKIINHGLYGETGPDLTEEAVDIYLNDMAKWPHTDKTQYRTSGKIGWEIMKGFEVGINTRFTYQKAERYNISSYGTSEYSDGEWSNPDNILTAYTFTWPEKYVYTFAPYFNYENDFFSIRGNAYYTMDSDYVDAYANISETTVPRWGGAHSNWQNSITGFNLFPSFRLAKWNKLNTSILYRFDRHVEKEKVMSNYASLTGMAGWRAADLITLEGLHGSSWFDTKRLDGHQLTLAVEDEIKIGKSIFLTAGISYDAQWLTKFQELDDAADTSLTNRYEVKDDALIMGTRDSFNPVIGATFKPIKDLLTMRAAFSMKSRFPTLAAYADTDDAAIDTGMKPERSYNYNIGAEVNLLRGILNIRTDYFLNSFTDKLERVEISGEKQYINIDGAMVQGCEIIINGEYKKLFNFVDLTYGFSYTFVHTKNQTDIEDTNVNMGDEPENTPKHYISFEVRAKFKNGMSVGLWGTSTVGEIMYAMNEDLIPPADGTTGGYSTAYFKKVKLHNPVKLNIKLENEFNKHISAYLMIKNLLDDYNADPFNPGPGLQFCLGARASL